MDAIFAILVLGVVILFGALISAGNERQRKAIDGIREQAAQWAMQDLRLKREHLARDVKVDDPVVWLNRVVAKVVGEDLELVVTEILDNPKALMCMTSGGQKMVLSPFSSDEVFRVAHRHGSRLSQVGIVHPLRDLSKCSEKIEVTILNAGLLFDQELQIAWKLLYTSDTNVPERLWLYLY